VTKPRRALPIHGPWFWSIVIVEAMLIGYCLLVLILLPYLF
jgi:hypothetical protein